MSCIHLSCSRVRIDEGKKDYWQCDTCGKKFRLWAEKKEKEAVGDSAKECMAFLESFAKETFAPEYITGYATAIDDMEKKLRQKLALGKERLY
jgi:hypothetical protein